MTLRTCITAALLAAAAPAFAQQGVDIALAQPDFTTWQLFGSVTARNDTPGNGFTYSAITLTNTGSSGQAGAGFTPTALALDFDQAFRFSFNFYIPVSTELRGDGLTFTLATTPGVGGTGSGLGYEGLGPSVALAIDTFSFDDEPASPSLQILAGGSTTPLAATETGLGDSIRDPDFQWWASLEYTPSGQGNQAGTLLGKIEHLNLGSFSVQANVDFAALGIAGNDVFYGFTAANGAATDGHVVGWGAPLPVPEPGTWALFAAGLVVMGNIARRRRVLQA